ncbi:MAG: hypothetical protein AB1345_14710 [Chloroflexota bacterium]
MLYLALALLSAATLLFEINLTRLFSVAQFYHFASLIVSLALLGYGASGTALSLFPGWTKRFSAIKLSYLALGAAVSMLAGYLLTNWVPFDSFSIAVERKQIFIFTLHYLALATPFFFGGLAVGLILAAAPQVVGKTYAVNLVGSAVGCVLALITPSFLGGEGIVVASCGLASLAACLALIPGSKENSKERGQLGGRWWSMGLAGCFLVFSLFDTSRRLAHLPTWSGLEVRISPYKGLSYALQYPEARVISQQWNAVSRVDVVSSAGIRSLPGLSYRYPQSPPPELGLFVDGDNLNPVVNPSADLSFADFMPSAIAYQLRPGAQALILEARGGLEVLVALEEGARGVTAVEENNLVIQAASTVYTDPRVQVANETDRSFLRRSEQYFDVVVFSLADSYHPVGSGAYSLMEDFRFTLESFQDALARLTPDGIIVVTRWLQVPPSEWLRAFGLAVEALEGEGFDPRGQIVAFRGYSTGTLLVKREPFTPQELTLLRSFTTSRAFDLVYAPDIRLEEINRYNILPEPIYYQAFGRLLNSTPREAFYAHYTFDVSPPTDDHPFYGHYFKWSQAEQVLSEFGKTWQPFGGAGYFVLLASLMLALVMATTLILLPTLVATLRARTDQSLSHLSLKKAFPGLMYFGLIGLGFMQVEIPLIQQFILYLGHPAYALTAVLGALLLFSGVGSRFAHRLPHREGLAALVTLLVIFPWLLTWLFGRTLGWSLLLRLILTLTSLAPLGFLMGMPFPRGISSLEQVHPGLIPWVWSVNGAASVISSLLAALLSLSWGLRFVFFVGAGCYLGAWFTLPVLSPRRSLPPHQ